MTAPVPPVSEPVDLDRVTARAQQVVDNAAHYSIESVYLARDVISLLSAVASLTQQRDAAREDLRKQSWGDARAAVEKSKLTDATADRLRAELAEANRQREISDGVTAQVKQLMEQRTTTLRERAEQAEAERDEARDLAVRRANAYLDAVHDRNAAHKQAEQAQAELRQVRELFTAVGWVNESKPMSWATLAVDRDLAQNVAALVNGLAALATSAPQPKDTINLGAKRRLRPDLDGKPVIIPAAPQPADAVDPDQPNDFDSVTGRLVPVVYVPQPKDAEPTCGDCGHAAHVGWSCSYIHRSGSMQVNSHCGCYVKAHAAPAAAVPSSGGPVRRASKYVAGDHPDHPGQTCDEYDASLIAQPEASGGQDTAADCPACGHDSDSHMDDNGTPFAAPGCHHGDCPCSNTRASVLRLADEAETATCRSCGRPWLSKRHECEPATAGGTASSVKPSQTVPCTECGAEPGQPCRTVRTAAPSTAGVTTDGEERHG